MILSRGWNAAARPMVAWWVASVLMAASMGGRVVFEDGSPVRVGSVEFRRRGEERQRFAARIGPDGRFVPAASDGHLGLPPGNYEAVVVQVLTHGVRACFPIDG